MRALAYIIILIIIVISNDIYIYAVELLSGPSLALLKVIIWSKFVFF